MVMSDDKREENIASEIAYVKALAEEGRNAPLIGGRFYLIWGGLMGAAALVTYLAAIDLISLGRASGYIPWVTAGVAGWILSFTIGRRAGTKPGALTVGNKTALAVWLSVGIFMSALFITLMIIHDNYTQYGVPAYFLFFMMIPIGFGVYGIAFYATATAANLGWLKWFAVLSWGLCVATLFMMGTAAAIVNCGDWHVCLCCCSWRPADAP